MIRRTKYWILNNEEMELVLSILRQDKGFMAWQQGALINNLLATAEQTPIQPANEEPVPYGTRQPTGYPQQQPRAPMPQPQVNPSQAMAYDEGYGERYEDELDQQQPPQRPSRPMPPQRVPPPPQMRSRGQAPASRQPAQQPPPPQDDETEGEADQLEDFTDEDF